MFRDTLEFKEIHPEKNDIKQLLKLKKGSDKKIWWECFKSECGGHIWQAIISNRTRKKYGCSICANRKICLCENHCNSFGYLQPELAKEWHPTKNNTTPFDHAQASNKKVWWICNRSKCGKHEWKTTISSRTGKIKTGCPYCSNKKICSCINKCNSLGFLYPELTRQWHSTKNKKTPYDYALKSSKRIWWKCDESKCRSHEWQASIDKRTLYKTGCPYCANRKICPCKNKCNSLGFLYPELAKEWHPIKNNNSSFDYSPGNDKKIWWKCNKSECGGHEWKATIGSRAGKSKGGCSICVNQKICLCKDRCNSFGYLHPDLAKQWHPVKNKKSPYEYSPFSGIKIWWKCNKNHIWEATICNRTGTNKTGCSVCNESHGEKLTVKILNSFNAEFIQQKTFKDCASEKNKSLKFDFYIPSLKTCIEYDGIQHFEYVDHFHKNDEGFHIQKRRDDIKSTYCQYNNIKLLRVNYMQSDAEIKNDIKKLVIYNIILN